MQDIFDEDGDLLVPYYVLPYKIEKQERGDWTYEVALGDGELVATSREELFDKAKEFIVANIAKWGEPRKDSYGRDFGLYVTKNYDLASLEKLNYELRTWDDWQDLANKKPNLGFPYIIFDNLRVELRIASQLRPSFVPNDTERAELLNAVIKAKDSAVEFLKNHVKLMEADEEADRLERKRAELAKLKAELGEE